MCVCNNNMWVSLLEMIKFGAFLTLHCYSIKLFFLTLHCLSMDLPDSFWSFGLIPAKLTKQIEEVFDV